MNIRTLALTYRSMQRLREIVGVFSRHGFQQVLTSSGLARFVPVSYRVRRGDEAGEITLGAPERMRTALQELGPAFVKLGQMLSTRPDLVPEEYAQEFRKLQDRVEPFSFREAVKVIEEEYASPLGEVFASVEEKPLAAASIAQVHRAVLKSGETVVLKIRRPGIEKVITNDLAVLRMIVDAVEHYVVESRTLSLPVIVDEFSRAIRKELDFYLEASNAQRIRKNLASMPEVVVPVVRWDLTTTRILAMEEADGIPASDIARVMEISPEERHRLAGILARAYMSQILEDGVFHADMHAGNIRFTDDGRVVFLDFGSVGYLSESLQDSLGNLFTAIIAHDYSDLVEEFIRLGAVDVGFDPAGFERDLREMVEPYHGRPINEIRVGEILKEGISIALRYKVRVPPELVLLGKATLTLEGLVRRIDPGINVVEEAAPFARRMMLKKLDPRRQIKYTTRLFRDYRDLAVKLPSQLTRIFQKILESKLTIEFMHRGYENALDEMDRSSNRISASLIISAIVVGSALLAHSGKGPQLWGFPILGLLGFLVAGIMGLGLAIRILRSGKY